MATTEIKPYAYELAKDLLKLMGIKPSAVNAQKLMTLIQTNFEHD
jgi:hypothetical protein